MARADKGLGLSSGVGSEVEKGQKKPSTSPPSRPVARADSEELVMKGPLFSTPLGPQELLLTRRTRTRWREPRPIPLALLPL